MKILTVPNRLLYQQAKPVKVIGPELQPLINRMFITMYQAKGIGLAAPQVGIMKQIIVLNMRYSPMVLVNSVIRYVGHETTKQAESCLSIPGYATTVERSGEIYVTSYNRHGKKQNFEAHGLLARVIQHEVDHLQGILITDHE